MSKILIIDDSSFQRKNIRRALSEEGYEILEASGGQQGLDMIETESPNCILTDLIMPDVDGIDVLTSVHKEHPHIPIIVLTADIQEGTRQECLELGADMFVNKPVKGNEVRRAVKSLLAPGGLSAL